MKKANFSLVVASVMFLLFVGVQSVSAQSAFTQGDLTAKDMDISSVDLVEVSDAIVILSDAYKALASTQPSTLSAEANQAARLAYYEFLLESLHNGQGIEDVLPNSNDDLLLISWRFQSSMNVDPVAIYDETVSMLEL